MGMASKPPTAYALGEAVFNERKFVDVLIQAEVLPRLEGRGLKTPSEKLFYELLSRVHPWITTLGRLAKPRHPARWTDATLEVDARAAHAATPKEFAWPVDLEEFYATRYPPICWNVHGSGAAGMRFVAEDTIPLLGAQAMVEGLNFAVRCAQLVLVEFGLFGASAKAAFSECQRKRTAILKQILREPEFPSGMADA